MITRFAFVICLFISALAAAGPRSTLYSKGKADVATIVQLAPQPPRKWKVEEYETANLEITGQAAEAILSVLAQKIAPEVTEVKEQNKTLTWYSGLNVACLKLEEKGEKPVYRCIFQIEQDGSIKPSWRPEPRGGGSVSNRK